MDADDHVPATPAPQATLADWWRAAWPSALLMRPRWPAERAAPTTVALLVLATLAAELLLSRLHIDGPARFYAPALATGWLPTVLAAWLCWALAPRDGQTHDAGRAPSASALFAINAAQTLVLALAINLGVLVPMRTTTLGATGLWLAWLLPLVWWIAAQALLFWRGAHGSPRARAAGVAALAVVGALGAWSEPLRLWYPEEAQAERSAEAPFQLTPALIDAQSRTLARSIDALGAERRAEVEMVALTFAPYADEDVFLRESDMVARVMAERFGARTLQLVNHRRTVAEHPWATPENLERAIAAAAARMQRDEDVLFIHLTSHGARSGSLAAAFWPLGLESLTPQRLKAALDAAGIRHRVISVSACYAGSWIAPLADEHTLVMTAADAEHTSYGCGRGSELTYFGRAMFDEALRSGLSFEDAHAKARTVIEQREKDAGKSDGYSNPQIAVGARAREQLARLARPAAR